MHCREIVVERSPSRDFRREISVEIFPSRVREISVATFPSRDSRREIYVERYPSRGFRRVTSTERFPSRDFRRESERFPSRLFCREILVERFTSRDLRRDISVGISVERFASRVVQEQNSDNAVIINEIRTQNTTLRVWCTDLEGRSLEHARALSRLNRRF